MGLEGKTIIVGVCGGIAAYKTAELVSTLVKQGADVTVIMTEAAKQFIGEATFQALTHRAVYSSIFTERDVAHVAHIQLADEADLVIVAPATANTIARLAGGAADDMMTAVVLATRAPVLIAPAMNCNMYQHPAFQRNLEQLGAYGYYCVGPESGRLACGWRGQGRMSEPGQILERAVALLAEKAGVQPLFGKKIIVTAGPTQERLDPIRFFSNRSSGKMGYALADAAARLGAQVTLISGPVTLAVPPHVHLIRITTALELRAQLRDVLVSADALIQSAAVADYRPEHVSEQKIKKSDDSLTLHLVRNPDILREIGEEHKTQLLVGFAAETEHLAANARRKLAEKHLDLLVANLADDAFTGDTNRVTLFFADGHVRELEKASKTVVAGQICAAVADLFAKGRPL
ncbi:MAG: bifunctional phosphopantothenoylcysteine decarboxylase/phosphopantothenate--cysteine ligase CoaBC [Sporolactobacillus sp.]